MNKVLGAVLLTSCLMLLSACSTSGDGYKNEFSQLAMVTGSAPGMSPTETEAAIQRAYLDGTLTAEQARKAHIQLDVKGHQTAEEIAVINRDRLAQRSQHESKKENLDVVRDTAQTGSSVLSDLNNMRGLVQSLFD